jgi:hypothetical protein
LSGSSGSASTHGSSSSGGEEGAAEAAAEAVRITFSIQPEMADLVRRESDEMQVSVSTFLRQVIDRYTRWASTAGKAGFVPVPRRMVTLMLDAMTDDQVVGVARAVAGESLKEIQLLMRGKNTLESFLDSLEAWAKESDMPYRKKIVGSGRTYEFTLQHDMGRKWSLYLHALCEAMFYAVDRKKGEFHVADNILFFRVPLN